MGISLDSHSDYLENADQKEKRKKRDVIGRISNPCVRTRGGRERTGVQRNSVYTRGAQRQCSSRRGGSRKTLQNANF